MSAVTAFELPVKTPLPQITMTPKILGPFELAVRWSGLDLSNSAVTRSGSWVKSICMILVCIVICLLMFLKSLMLMMDSAKPMTLEWVISCVWGFMALHGFASALCVVSWTRSRFLPQLQTTLSTLQNQQGPSCGLTDFASLYRRIVIGAALLITTWVLSSMKDRLFEGFQANSSEPFSIGYPVNLSTMYGLDPFVYLAVGISSSLAMTVYVLVYAHVNREWATFNEDLSNTLRLHQLAVRSFSLDFQ
ncbi:unnamed protein product [Heligmosomoides polygyrus]|uniref:Lysosomal cobalamin transporter n=1 Tax=Heligmosomoides polygyrus TaxID=6339 RepID=A0A3P7YYU7_HELPZ|nr:unnamed protein product [Heligmosomoides polygyrus]